MTQGETCAHGEYGYAGQYDYAWPDMKPLGRVEFAGRTQNGAILQMLARVRRHQPLAKNATNADRNSCLPAGAQRL